MANVKVVSWAAWMADPKAETMAALTVYSKAESTAEKKVPWMVDPKDDYSAGKLVDCSE